MRESTMLRDDPSSSLGPSKPVFPIYVRIVPKDVWLRFHISPGQTIASIKDAALIHARAAEQDPTHSVRFYLDAVDAITNAKQALAAGNAHTTKQRNNSLPTVFTTPLPADLAPTLIKNAAAFSSSVSPRQNLISLPHRAALSALTSHWSPTKSNSALGNADKRNLKAQPSSDLYQSLSSSSSQLRPHKLASSASTRSISAYENIPSQPINTTSTTSLPSSDTDAHTFTAPLRGNLRAKQEEGNAQARLLQWSQSSASLLTNFADSNGTVQHVAPHSQHANPALGSSFNESSLFATSHDFDDEDSIAHPQRTTTVHTDPYGFSAPSIVSRDETLSNASSSDDLLLVTDDSSGVNWGTQAEDSLTHTDLSPNANAFAAISSPTRSRSRTVTAADSQAGPSTANDATLRPRGRPLLVAETTQRRAVTNELLGLFNESERGIVRPGSPSSTLVDPEPSRASPLKSTNTDVKPWSDRGRMAPMPSEDVTHPLSKRYAVLSATTGCVLEDWKSAAACKLRPYDMVQLQWFIPTERVYTSCFTGDMIRDADKSGIAGPHPDSELLEPYYEGWVYMLEEGQPPKSTSSSGKSAAAAAARLQLATWRLRWITIKGWRLDMYSQRPRAGEISLPPSDSTWPLLAIQHVDVASSPIAANAFLPALETLHGSSISVSFSPLPISVGNSGMDSALTAAAPSLTIRCISRYEHEALHMLLSRAQRRVHWRAHRGTGTLIEAQLTEGVDRWRRQALFRALVAGRGGTVQAAGKPGRNARTRARQRPANWPAAWEDADQWSSDSQEEDNDVSPTSLSQLGLFLPPELTS